MRTAQTARSRRSNPTVAGNLAQDFKNIKLALVQTGTDLKDKIVQKSYDIKDKTGEIIDDTIDSAKRKSRDVKNNLTDFLVEKPASAVGILIAAGLAIGYFFRK